MPTYLVEGTWSGYSRGYAAYEVDADSLEEAKELWIDGTQMDHYVVRDDTEFEPDTVKLISN